MFYCLLCLHHTCFNTQNTLRYQALHSATRQLLKKLNFNALSDTEHPLFLYSFLRGAGTDPEHHPSVLCEKGMKVYAVQTQSKKSFIPH